VDITKPLHSSVALTTGAPAVAAPLTAVTEWWRIEHEFSFGDGECALSEVSPAQMYEYEDTSGYNPRLIDNGNEVGIEERAGPHRNQVITYYKGKTVCETALKAKHDAAEAKARSLDKYR
jgi:hypothetical protein